MANGNNNPNFIGVLFPYQKGQNGIPASAVDINLIRSDLRLLLNTRVGERVMLPTFGLSLENLVFENTGPLLRAKAFRQISDAIGNFERRIRVRDIQITEDENTVTIDLYYSILGVNDMVSVDFSRTENGQ